MGMGEMDVLEARMGAIVAAAEELKADVREALRDHEKRIRSMETSVTKLTVFATLAAIVGSMVGTALIKVLLGG